MNDALLKLWIGAQIRVRNFWEDLKSEEKGAVEIITMLLIVVVVIALVALFRDKIKALIDTVFGNTTNQLDNLGKELG